MLNRLIAVVFATILLPLSAFAEPTATARATFTNQEIDVITSLLPDTMSRWKVDEVTAWNALAYQHRAMHAPNLLEAETFQALTLTTVFAYRAETAMKATLVDMEAAKASGMTSIPRDHPLRTQIVEAGAEVQAFMRAAADLSVAYTAYAEDVALSTCEAAALATCADAMAVAVGRFGAAVDLLTLASSDGMMRMLALSAVAKNGGRLGL